MTRQHNQHPFILTAEIAIKAASDDNNVC